MNKRILPRTVPSRDERYMGLAFMLAGFSKDPSSQFGAIVVSSENIPLGMGYNGPPKQYDDGQMDWSRPEKYPHILHAETNAIDHSDKELLDGSTIYVSGKPCPLCMLDIVRSGIGRVIYFPYKNSDPASMMNNKNLFNDIDEIAKRGKVTMEVFKGNLNWLKDWIIQLDDLCVF